MSDEPTPTPPKATRARVRPSGEPPKRDRPLPLSPGEREKADQARRARVEARSNVDHNRSRKGDAMELETPEWVAEAEELYLSRRLTSQAAVAKHFDVTKASVAAWATRRDWGARRKKVEATAAKKIRERIEETASTELADTFAAINQNTIAAGLRVSHYINAWATHLLKDQQEAIQKGDKKLPIPSNLPSAMLQVLQAAQALQPQERVESTVLDDLGALLNPNTDPNTIDAPEAEDEDEDDFAETEGA